MPAPATFVADQAGPGPTVKAPKSFIADGGPPQGAPPPINFDEIINPVAPSAADDNLQRAAQNFYDEQSVASRLHAIAPVKQSELKEWHPSLWDKVRNSDIGHKLFGPTDVERQGMEEDALAGPPGGNVGLVPIALSTPGPWLPANETMAGKALLSYFVASNVAQQPQRIGEISELLDKGDKQSKKAAYGKILEDVLQTGMAAGAAHGLVEGITAKTPGAPSEAPKSFQPSEPQPQTAKLDSTPPSPSPAAPAATVASGEPPVAKVDVSGLESAIKGNQLKPEISGSLPKAATSVPEPAATIAAQVAATLDPATPKAVTLLAAGEVPPKGHGLTALETTQGTILVNPDKVEPVEAKKQFDAGGGGKLLGFSTDVKPAGDAVLQTKTADGTPVMEEVINAATLPAARAAGRKIAPGGSQEIKPAEDVLRERLANAETPPPTEAKPAIVGLGAAIPSEFENSPTTPTGILNSVVDKERQKLGLPPAMQPARRSFGPVWDEAMARIDQNPDEQDALINELREKPRAVTDLEDALLLHRQIDLQNQYGKATRDMAQAYDDATQFPNRLADVEELRVRTAKLSDDLLDLYNINKSVGTETARGLSARRMMAYEDFSLAKMELEKRSANGGRPLTPDEHADIARLQKKIEDTQKAFDDYVAKTEAERANRAANETVADLNAKVEAEDARLPRGENSGTRKLGAMTDQQNITAGLKNAVAEKRPLHELGSFIQKLAESFVRQGVKERDPLIDKVHGVLKTMMPDISRRQTMDAISGYGDFKPLNPDAVKAQLRDLKGQMQQVAKLEDLQARQPLQKTGVERKVPSDEERRLIKQVNEAKRRFGVVVTDPARQLKSSLDAIKTRLRNQIADLEHQISTKQKTVKTKTPPATDPEADLLRAKRDSLKRDFDEIFTRAGLSDAQRVQNAMRATKAQIDLYELRLKNKDASPLKPESKTPSTPELEAMRARRDALREEFQNLQDVLDPARRDKASLSSLKTRLRNQIAEHQERLAAGDFAPRQRRTLPLDAEAQRLKAENERAKNQFQRGLMTDRLKNRKWYVKAQDTLVKWRRGFLLSSPVTLAKLTSAAAQRMAFTPIEEAIGGVLSKIPGISQVAERAPSEGGFSSKAEAKAISSAVTKGMADAAAVLRRGESEIDVLQSKGRDEAVGEAQVMPRSVIDFFGQVHGMLKAPVKRAAYERSLEKRLQFYIRQGMDVSDPMVQTRAMMEAYKDSQRSIFLQNNFLVDRMNRLFAPNIDKATGKATVGSKVWSTTGRVLLPIVRVPTNIAGETFQYATGLVTGSARLGNAFRTGIDSLPPEHADLIMRDLKKGLIGAAVLTLGYLLPNAIGGYYQPGQKRKPGDVAAGNVKMFGHEVPSYLLHNPLLEVLQLGATIRRVADSKLHRTDGVPQGKFAGMVAGGLGLTEQVPFVREQLEVAKAFDQRTRASFFGELAKSIAVPQLAQWLAARGDKDGYGQPMPRKPATVLQHVEMGVPGLREHVPLNAAEVKQNKIAHLVAIGKARGFQSDEEFHKAVIAAGVDTKEGETRIKDQIQLEPLAYQVKYLPLENAMDTFALANHADKVMLAPMMADKMQTKLDEVMKFREGNLTPEDNRNFTKMVQSVQPYLQEATQQAQARRPPSSPSGLRSFQE